MRVYFLLLKVITATEFSLLIQTSVLNHCCINMFSPQYTGIPSEVHDSGKTFDQYDAKAQAVQLRLFSCLSNPLEILNGKSKQPLSDCLQ